jgi:phosphopantothenoylcysteine decarboxylase/phosphopantothenate--cysteine ligase
MFESKAVQRNLEILRGWGVNVVEPAVGHLACGEEGAGKFPEPRDIADEIEFSSLDKNKMLLITIGRTEEAIDPVRYISNRSSGKTGVAIAREFLRNGWRVAAVCGPMEAELPRQCEVVRVESAVEMNKAVLKMQSKAGVVVHCAAVADYSPKRAALQKIKDSRGLKNLELRESPNILRNTVENKKGRQKIVAFALETENAVEFAKKKFKESGADILVVNKAGSFGKDFVEYGILDGNKNVNIVCGSKEGLAAQLFGKVNG